MEDVKKKARKMLKEKMKKKMRGKVEGKMPEMKKVSVMSDSKEGLEKGLSMAEKILKKKGMEFGCGGKSKFKNGGKKDEYKLPADIKAQADKMSGKDERYELPKDIKSQINKLEAAFKKRKKK